MQGVNLLYKNNQGVETSITNKQPQFIYLEPLGRVVIRYYFEKSNLSLNSTKIMNDVVDRDLLSVKIKKPYNEYLSKFSDFRDIAEREDSLIQFEVDFNTNDRTYLDVLYKSKTEDRLKVKIRTSEDSIDSFENENTVTDGPDEYVKTVAVVIKPSGVDYVYVYREEGRLRKAPSTITYPELASILKTRLFDQYHPDHNLSRASIERGLVEEGWAVDHIDSKIIKQVDLRVLEMSDNELGVIIKDYGDKRDILNLLKTNDYVLTDFILIRENENYLVSCDSDCSLPSAIVQNTIDERITV